MFCPNLNLKKVLFHSNFFKWKLDLSLNLRKETLNYLYFTDGILFDKTEWPYKHFIKYRNKSNFYDVFSVPTQTKQKRYLKKVVANNIRIGAVVLKMLS